MTDEEGQLIRGAQDNPIVFSDSLTLKPRSTVHRSHVELAIRIRPALIHHSRPSTSVGNGAAKTLEEMSWHGQPSERGFGPPQPPEFLPKAPLSLDNVKTFPADFLSFIKFHVDHGIITDPP